MKRQKNRATSVMIITAMLLLFALHNTMQAADRVMLSAQTAEAGVSAPAVDDALLGTWTIERVNLKRTVGTATTNQTYSLSQKFETFEPCPRKITFGADGKAVIDYGDRTTGPDQYTVEGNQIKVMVPVAVYTYEYKVTEAGQLQLVYSLSYSRDSKPIVEVYTYYGVKR